MKPYYYLRIPVERNESAKKFLGKQLLVSFVQVDEGEILMSGAKTPVMKRFVSTAAMV